MSYGWENGGCKASDREGVRKKKYMSMIMTLPLMHAPDFGTAGDCWTDRGVHGTWRWASSSQPPPFRSIHW